MRGTWMNSLLAATTAATLVAGVSLASAQVMGGSGGHGAHQGAAGGSRGGGGGHVQMQSRSGGFSQPHARSFGGGGGSGGGVLHAQRAHGLGAQHTMRSEQLGHRSRTTMQTGTSHGQRGHALAQQRGHGGQTLAEQRRMHGQNLKTTSRTGTQTKMTRSQRGTHAFAQAGTRSHAVSLSSQQRARIHNVVLQRGFISRLRVRNVNFNIRIGVFVPRSFHLFVIPEDIVFIAPQFRGFRCFVFEDELVIVDPFTFEIIAIIPV
jgi:hypothetical protein